MQLMMGRGPGGTEEWFLLEMQGDLESRNQDHLEGKFIGDLHFTHQGRIRYNFYKIVVAAALAPPPLDCPSRRARPINCLNLT